MPKKVLAVDDSFVILKAYKPILRKYGCEIVDAMNGLQALKLLRNEKDFDLILLDIDMPGMNGIDFLVNFRAAGIYNHIPVIIVSTDRKEKDTQKGLSLGARGYIKKPFRPSELYVLIDKLKKRKN